MRDARMIENVIKPVKMIERLSFKSELAKRSQ